MTTASTPEIRATAGGDWWTGVGASYVPCPNDCGRMVASCVAGREIAVTPCSRCRLLGAMTQKAHDRVASAIK